MVVAAIKLGLLTQVLTASTYANVYAVCCKSDNPPLLYVGQTCLLFVHGNHTYTNSSKSYRAAF